MSSSEYVDYLRQHGVVVGKNVNFRYPAHTMIDLTRPCLVEFGHDLDINDHFAVLTHDFGTFVFRGLYQDFINSSGKVTIGNNIVIGRGVTILKGVTIGDNCVIGAGSIVSKSIPSNSVAVGVPAKVICSIDEYYAKRKKESLVEAFEYAKELAHRKGGLEKLEIGDFTEEWVLFLSEEEYNNNYLARKYVDFRLKGRMDVKSFLNKSRPFENFNAFIEAVKNDL